MSWDDYDDGGYVDDYGYNEEGTYVPGGAEDREQYNEAVESGRAADAAAMEDFYTDNRWVPPSVPNPPSVPEVFPVLPVQPKGGTPAPLVATTGYVPPGGTVTPGVIGTADVFNTLRNGGTVTQGNVPAGSGIGSPMGRLVVTPLSSSNEQGILNMLRYHRGAAGWSYDTVVAQLQSPSYAEAVASRLGINVGAVQQVFSKVLSTGISGILMALTGNFPLAAMGYFASDRMLGADTGVRFQGWLSGAATVDGQPLLPMGMAIPEGLPNEIFNDFRFICFDRLSQRWWPSDEVRPLAYQGNEYRWVCLDRVDGKMYHANWIKKPVVYV